MPCFLAIDVGTGCVKAGLFDTVEGEWHGFATRALGTRLDGDRAEQDANEYWSAAQAVVADLHACDGAAMARVAAIAVTGQMRGLVMVDREGDPIAPVLTLYDRRGRDEADAFLAEFGLAGLYRITGQRFNAASVPAKLRWLERHSAGLLRRARWVLAAKDYIRFRMTGVAATDPTDAAGWLLYDLAAGCWHPELLRFAGATPSQVPPIESSGSVTGRLRPDVAAAWGVPEGAIVVVGAGDDIAAIGAGAHCPGDVYEHIGSTGSIFAVADRPVLDPEHVVECYPAEGPGRFWIGGSCNSAGSTIERALRCLGVVRERAIDWSTARAYVSTWASEPPDRRPLYLPYWMGERCPIWNADYRAAWLGLSQEHTTGQMTVAAFEGVALLLGWIASELRRVGVDMSAVYSAGRCGEDESFGRMRATVYGLPVRRLEQADAALFGAVLIAAVAAGDLESVDAGLERWAGCRRTRWVVFPDTPMAVAYGERLAVFRRWTQLLAPGVTAKPGNENEGGAAT
jgi:xylulokinase